MYKEEIGKLNARPEAPLACDHPSCEVEMESL